MTHDVTQKMVELYCLGVLPLERQWQVEEAFDACPQVQQWFVVLGELPRHVSAELDAENRASFASTVKTASRELSETELGDLLTDALQARQRRHGGPILLRQVTVVRGWPRSACEFLDQDQKKWNQRIASFGRDVAPYLARLLNQSRVVGLSMGHTIADAITHLKQYLETFPLSHQELVEFVATVGGDVNHPHVRRERNSSLLATELSNVVNGSWKQAYTLHGIPSFLSDVHGPDLEVVRNYIAARPCVQRVMERANHLDMLVTSCGRADRAMAFWNDELGRLEVGFAEFSRLTECEIGGVLVPRSDLSARDQEQVEEMQRRWTGITLDHYRQCARSAGLAAGSASGAGVVLLALDESKAAYALSCVDQGLVNQLIIDRDLAEPLASLLECDEPMARRSRPAETLRTVSRTAREES